MDEILSKIFNAYEVNATEVSSPQKGYRNSSYLIKTTSGDLLNLILYKRETGILNKIKCANYVSSHLKDNGLLVRYPIGKILKLKEDYFACLYNYLPGKTIPWEGYTMNHIKSVGEYLNKIHFYGQNIPSQNLVKEAELLKVILSRVEKYFKNEDVVNALNQKLKIKINFLEYLKTAPKLIDKIEKSNKLTVLHMDFVRGNILFKEGTSEISGVIDFEKSSIGSPLFDIARTLAFLLVDCKFKPENKIRKYFLKSGYIKRGELKLDSYDYLNELIMIYLIYDFYKFLKHNPYEFLSKNEHFIRTVNVLKLRNLLL